MTDALAELSAAGVAVWIDDLSRERLRSGNLQELVDTRSVVGVTTNPSIFQKALSDGAAYDAQVRDLALRGTDVGEAVRALTTYDVRWACDVLRPQYDSSNSVDGRVSIEVDPRISHDVRRGFPGLACGPALVLRMEEHLRVLGAADAPQLPLPTVAVSAWKVLEDRHLALRSGGRRCTRGCPHGP